MSLANTTGDMRTVRPETPSSTQPTSRIGTLQRAEMNRPSASIRSRMRFHSAETSADEMPTGVHFCAWKRTSASQREDELNGDSLSMSMLVGIGTSTRSLRAMTTSRR